MLCPCEILQTRSFSNLPDECWQGIHPHLHEVELPLGTVLCDAGHEVTNVHFPLSGLISAVIPLLDGAQIEAGVVGRTDLAGCSCQPHDA